MTISVIIFLTIALYLALGFVFAIPFLITGVSKIDEGAKELKVGFRLIILPGTMVFWPFLLRKWLKVKSKKNDML